MSLNLPPANRYPVSIVNASRGYYQMEETLLTAWFIFWVRHTVVHSRRQYFAAVKVYCKRSQRFTMKTTIMCRANWTAEIAVCLERIVFDIFHATHRTCMTLKWRLLRKTTVNTVTWRPYASRTSSNGVFVFSSHISATRWILDFNDEADSATAFRNGSSSTLRTCSTVKPFVSK